MNVPPAVIDEDSEIGRRYIAAMELAGRYAYAGREWVVERVRKIIGGAVTDRVHNHHNYAWREKHDGRDLWVVRKGATPAFPGQRGFVGGSMGDDAVIIEGVESPTRPRRRSIRPSTAPVGCSAARRPSAGSPARRWTRGCQSAACTLVGADLDESPMAYRRLPEVLAHHSGLDQGAAHLAPVRRGDGRRRRVRSVQGLTAAGHAPRFRPHGVGKKAVSTCRCAKTIPIARFYDLRIAIFTSP